MGFPTVLLMDVIRCTHISQIYRGPIRIILFENYFITIDNYSSDLNHECVVIRKETSEREEQNGDGLYV